MSFKTILIGGPCAGQEVEINSNLPYIKAIKRPEICTEFMDFCDPLAKTLAEYTYKRYLCQVGEITWGLYVWNQIPNGDILGMLIEGYGKAAKFGLLHDAAHP